MEHKKYKLNESLREGDLRDVVDSLLEIDRYKPKLGDEADTVVVTFKADTQEVATDLGAYLEWSAKEIDDVEVSNASDKDGKFHVYIELKRLPGLNEKIIEIVKDVEHATGEQDWKFVGMDGLRKPLDLGTLNQTIIQDAKLYSLPPESREYYLRMRNLTKY
jgi:nitrate reductase NapAB chaperone NapD